MSQPASGLLPGRVSTMKAIVYRSYGPPDVLQLADLPRPVPADGEVLVRNRAVTVTS